MARRWLLVVVVLLALTGASCAGTDDYNPGPSPSDPGRLYLPRWEQGIEPFYRFQDRYQRQGKPFIAYFYSTYCPFCRELENKFINTRVFARTFYWYPKVMIGVNLSRSEKNLFKELGLTRTPGFVVFPAYGKRPVIISAYYNRYGTNYRKTPAHWMEEVRRAMGVPRDYRP